jgi:hypothetical protein
LISSAQVETPFFRMHVLLLSAKISKKIEPGSDAVLQTVTPVEFKAQVGRTSNLHCCWSKTLKRKINCGPGACACTVFKVCDRFSNFIHHPTIEGPASQEHVALIYSVSLILAGRLQRRGRAGGRAWRLGLKIAEPRPARGSAHRRIVHARPHRAVLAGRPARPPPLK